MSRTLKPLTELIPGYPEDAPQYGSELLQADYESLPAVAQDVRRHMVDALHSVGRKAITDPLTARKLLEDGHLRTLARRWVVYVLDAQRCRVLVNGKSGTPTWQAAYSKASRLPRKLPPLPEGGTYLAVYGGSPKVLTEPGTAAELRALAQRAPLADALFWHLVSGQDPTLYSLRAGKGQRGTTAVEFPDPDTLEEARLT